jgi:hypothetical protein
MALTRNRTRYASAADIALSKLWRQILAAVVREGYRWQLVARSVRLRGDCS